MTVSLKSIALMGTACVALVACQAPTLVSLQPIGAPEPTNAQQTFIDADGCSWWIIGNGSELMWAPMTNSAGEHVCDGGQTRIDPPGTQSPSPLPAAMTAPIAPIPETATVITPETAPVVAPTPAPSGTFFVQVATFAKESNVIASEALFESLGYRIEAGSDARDSSRLYRLILGPFADQASAQEAVEEAFNEGFDDAFPFRR